jgi:hypothetical protein
MILKEMQKSEEQMIKFAIQKSLIDETKYKDNKELSDKHPKQWYKNFMKESCNMAPEQDLKFT